MRCWRDHFLKRLSSIYRDLIPRGDSLPERNLPSISALHSVYSSTDRLPSSIDRLEVHCARAANVAKGNPSFHLLDKRRRIPPIRHVRPGRVPLLSRIFDPASRHQEQLGGIADGFCVKRTQLDRAERVLNLRRHIADGLSIRAHKTNQSLA